MWILMSKRSKLYTLNTRRLMHANHNLIKWFFRKSIFYSKKKKKKTKHTNPVTRVSRILPPAHHSQSPHSQVGPLSQPLTPWIPFACVCALCKCNHAGCIFLCPASFTEYYVYRHINSYCWQTQQIILLPVAGEHFFSNHRTSLCMKTTAGLPETWC